MTGFVLDNALVREYKQQLEGLLPSEIDGIESEGDMMVQYMYIRDSLEFKGLVDLGDTADPLTPYVTMWKYSVRSAWAPHEEMFEEVFLPTTGLTGFVHISVGPANELILDDVDFLLDLEVATRS